MANLQPPHIVYGPVTMLPGTGTTAPAPPMQPATAPAHVRSKIKHQLAPGPHWNPRPWR